MLNTNEIEMAVLGTCIGIPTAFSQVYDIIDEDSFLYEPHKFIYYAIKDLYENQFGIDLITVVTSLRENKNLEKVGGADYLVTLTNMILSSYNIQTHAYFLNQQSLKNKLLNLSDDIKRITKSEKPSEAYDIIETKLYSIGSDTVVSHPEDLSEIGLKFFKSLKEISNNKGINNIVTEFYEYDNLIRGLRPPDLHILAARPGMGKTSFVINVANNISKHKSVVFFSLEMSKEQLYRKLISSETGISNNDLLEAKLTDKDWTIIDSKIEYLSNTKLIIDDNPYLNISTLRTKCRYLKHKNKIDLVIIDYIGLMANDKGLNKSYNREQEMSKISRGLKALAKEMSIPIVALSQLSRSVENRGGNKRPNLSDLRDSGAIEQDADIVTFIYRPEYYNIIEDEEGQSLKGVTELIVAKNRHGGVGTAKIQFNKQNAKFTNIEEISNIQSFSEFVNKTPF